MNQKQRKQIKHCHPLIKQLDKEKKGMNLMLRSGTLQFNSEWRVRKSFELDKSLIKNDLNVFLFRNTGYI